ncbi:MAG TPA: GNAT family N-acetyltransferase [Chloroflexota bacterium]|nr:GNAT family N-acetyltransferase [Chloroflexota bacterium]
MEVTVTTWYLEMLDPAWLRPPSGAGRSVPAGLTLVRAEVPCPELNRFLYTAVGGDWWWTDRLAWTYERWLAYLDRPALQTWVGYVSGTPAGYFELERQEGAGPGAGPEVEIASFGLLPRFIGRGLGGALLTAAVERAWAIGGDPGAGVRRVWVHTCSLDGPHALANYRARGFRECRTATHTQALPAAPPGPWPGARVELSSVTPEGMPVPSPSARIPAPGITDRAAANARGEGRPESC